MYGRSLGGAMALWVAAHAPVAGLVLESPFYTAYRVVTQAPLVPFDKFSNKDEIGRIRCPVLVIHGLDDWIIQPWHGRELYARAPEPKRCLWVEGAGHNDVIAVAGARYDEALREFVALVMGGEK